MAVYLVRHGKAGDRVGWEGDDRLRPLSKKGRQQAARLAVRFGDIAVAQVLSSPFVRCIETVHPIAEAKGLEVVLSEVLAEGSSFLDVIELLNAVPDDTVLCSHGDVIPETVAALFRRGLTVSGPQDWRKGTTWVLERGLGGFETAHAWAPPLDD